MNSNNFKYALVVTAVIAVIAIVAGLIWVGKDVAAVLYLITAVLVPTVSAVLGVKISADTRDKVDEVQRTIEHDDKQ